MVVSSSASVFSKEAKNVFKEKLKTSVNSLIKAQKDLESLVGEQPRHSEDYLMSAVLLQKELPFYGLKADMLKSFLNDLYAVPRDLRVKKVVCFDTETTAQVNAYAVSIALILYNIETEEVEQTYYTLLNPLVDISFGAMEVHGITEADVKDERKFSQVANDITAIFEQADLLVGHNVEFDLKVIEKEYERINAVNPVMYTPYFDTMKMSKATVGARDINNKVKDPRLEEAVEFFNIPQPTAAYHNALVDTEMCLEVFKSLLLVQ